MESLLLGVGNNRNKLIYPDNNREWGQLTTLDIDPSANPDVLHDLNVVPWPFENESFNEIHAYEVFEHLGKQGDFKSFFDHFYECWRLLKPLGVLCGTVPALNSRWLWGDPGHTRAISEESLTFLSMSEYDKQVGVTPMTDYRWYWKGDFNFIWKDYCNEKFYFVLERQELRHESRS
jgi:hypothetical protein